MPCVSKCCCCCSLKYGNLVYGTVSIVSRICVLVAFFLWAFYVVQSFHDALYKYNDYHVAVVVLLTTASCIGWFICSSVAVFVALKGIIQRRSILLYPYIVILIFELIILLITGIIEAATINPLLILQTFVVGGIDVYALICLISLYQHMKQNEKRHPLLLESGQFSKPV